MKGNISYQALQRLTEQAWDEGDWQRVQMLSAAMDSCTVMCIQQEEECEQAM